MKASYYKIEPTERESFRCLRIRQRNLGAPWHFHPEYQITLVVRGRGDTLHQWGKQLCYASATLEGTYGWLASLWRHRNRNQVASPASKRRSRFDSYERV